MSSSSSSRNTSASARAVVAPTPFCKVCRDAGRPESEYTSHFVKDQPGPNGKVVCPMLLNQACRICHNTGHTSSYCPEYRARREEREPRREERYIEREPRHTYDALRADTERRDRETQERNDAYWHDQERRSKPWLQATLRAPYARPHGPRVRLNLETNALSASKHAAVAIQEKKQSTVPAIDIRKINLRHASNWGDEDVEEPFVCDPEQMFREFAQSVVTENLITPAEYEFIARCDDQSRMPFCCE